MSTTEAGNMSTVAEKNQSLWILTASPALWAAHFMLCYVTAAIWCSTKVAGPEASLWPVRMWIAVYTVVALTGIGIIGWIGFRRYRHGASTLPHDADTPEDRHRFLGFSTLLLSGLSAIATIYSALAAVFIETCQ